MQEVAAELVAARGAMAATQKGFGALLASFGESAAGGAGEGDVWRELADFAARFTAAQRQVQTRTDLHRRFWSSCEDAVLSGRWPWQMLPVAILQCWWCNVVVVGASCRC